MITPNDNINDNTLNVIIFEGQNVIIFKGRVYYHFSGVNVIIFEGLNVIIFKCRGCYHFSWCQFFKSCMLSFWSSWCYNFECRGRFHFSWCTGYYLFIKVSKCYHFCGIIFRVLSFMLTSNDNIKITQNMFKRK